MGDELKEKSQKSPLMEETDSIHTIIIILQALGPIGAKRVLDFVVTHQQERLANLMAQQRQRQKLENESVASVAQ